MNKEQKSCWFETMVNSEYLIYFVKICDSYKVWRYLAHCFEKIVIGNCDESKFIHLLDNIAEET